MLKLQMLKLNNKVSSVFAIAFLAAWASAAQAADVVRVSPFVYERGRLDPDTTDLVIAQLTSGAGVEVVERCEEIARHELVIGELFEPARAIGDETIDRHRDIVN